ncbi:ParB N-terminal domain-containing protein [Halosegnis rubeus]|nr:ParB N-terminal domain-containing protein [Halosegnis rubeus]
METRNPHELDRHDAHQEIYGDEDLPQDFVESVAQEQQTPIVVNEEDTIIDGYRRVQAAIQNDIEEVFVRVRPFDSVDEEKEAMIHSNKHRVKTFSQKMSEAMALMEIEQKKAKERQGSRNDLSQKFARSELGSANEKVAKTFDWSSTKFDQARKVWEAAQESQKMQRQVEKIDAGQQSVHGAFKVFKRWDKTQDLEADIEWDQIEAAGGAKSIRNREDAFETLQEKIADSDGWRDCLDTLREGHSEMWSDPSEGTLSAYLYMTEENDLIDLSSTGSRKPDSRVDKHPGENELWAMYWEDEMTLLEIALTVGVHRELIRQWFYEEDIPLRKQALDGRVQRQVD